MLQNNKINLIISIIAAIAIWVYVVVEINPDETKKIKNVPVKLTNVDTLGERGLALVEKEAYSIDVVIKGSRSDISQVGVADIEATANVFGYPQGKHDVKVMVTVPDKVSLEEVDPSFITLKINEYITAKKPIEIRYNGEFPDNTEPGLITMVPEEIEVSGAKSVVNKVEYVEAMVDISDVKNEETTIQARAVPMDKDNNPVEGLDISQEKISITMTLLHKKTVPLRVSIEGEVNPQYEVTSQKIPEEVNIIGVKSQIDKIKYLEAKPVNISNITETTEIPLEIELPSKVELSEESENISVVIEIGGITVSNYVVNSANIGFNGINDGYTASIYDKNVMVSVFGYPSVLNELVREDLDIFVDMSRADYSKNTFMGDINYTIDKDVNRVTVNPKKVRVIIYEKN